MNQPDEYREAQLIVRRDRSRLIEAAMAGRRACTALEEGHMHRTEVQLMLMVQLIREELAAQGMAPPAPPVTERSVVSGYGGLMGGEPR